MRQVIAETGTLYHRKAYSSTKRHMTAEKGREEWKKPKERQRKWHMDPQMLSKHKTGNCEKRSLYHSE